MLFLYLLIVSIIISKQVPHCIVVLDIITNNEFSSMKFYSLISPSTTCLRVHQLPSPAFYFSLNYLNLSYPLPFLSSNLSSRVL